MIWTFDNQRERWSPSTVKNTAVQSNFYSPRRDNRIAELALEHKNEHHRFGIARPEGQDGPNVKIVRRIEEKGRDEGQADSSLKGRGAR